MIRLSKIWVKFMAGEHFTNKRAECKGENLKILADYEGLRATYPKLGRNVGIF